MGLPILHTYSRTLLGSSANHGLRDEGSVELSREVERPESLELNRKSQKTNRKSQQQLPVPSKSYNGTVRKSVAYRNSPLVSSYRPSIVAFHPSLRVSAYCRFCAPARHFSPPDLYSPQNFPMFPVSRWMAFVLRRAKMLG